MMEETVEDRWGGHHTARSPDAVVRFDETVFALLGHREASAGLLDATLALDPDLIAARVLRGFALSFLGRNDRWPEAQEQARRARAALAHRGGTDRETLLTQALHEWLQRDIGGCRRSFDALLTSAPRDLLAIKLAHASRFIAGQPQEMRRSLERVLPAWDSNVPGYGYVLGCYAFSLVETGAYAMAEKIGRAAVEEEPYDAWGVHAVAHVFEMTERPSDGLRWLTAHEEAWEGANNFAGHIEWHRALYHIDLDQLEEAGALWERVVVHLGDDYRDFSNASSLLLRLEARGVDVTDRWRSLGALAEARAYDHGSAFADLHYLLILSRTHGPSAVRRVLTSMRDYVSRERHWQSRVTKNVGLPLAEGLRALSEGHPREAFDRWVAVPSTQPLGGSHAQRDTFEWLKLAAAVQSQDPALAERAIRARLSKRPANPWATHLLTDLTASPFDGSADFTG